jgi:hypothetical protein
MSDIRHAMESSIGRTFWKVRASWRRWPGASSGSLGCRDAAVSSSSSSHHRFSFLTGGGEGASSFLTLTGGSFFGWRKRRKPRDYDVSYGGSSFTSFFTRGSADDELPLRSWMTMPLLPAGEEEGRA